MEKFTWHVRVLIAVIVYMLVATGLQIYTENFDAEIYALRICESEICHTREQFRAMKDVVVVMRGINSLPVIGWLVPDSWDTMIVLQKKMWVKP